MFLTNKAKLYSDRLLFIIILIFPFSLLTGPFLTDLSLSLFSFFFLIILIYYRKWKYVNNIYFKIAIIWYFYILLNSLFAENRLLSLESSLFYLRFIMFAFGFYYILEENKKTILYFTVSLSIAFSFVLIDSLIQYFTSVNLFGMHYSGQRLSSVFGEEKILGSFISRVMPLLFSLLIYNFFKKKFTLIILILIFILSDMIVFLSGERTAFFYIILQTFLMLLLVEKYKITRIISAILSIFFIIYLSYSNNNLKYRMFDHTLNQMNINNNIEQIKTEKFKRDELENNKFCNRGVCNYNNQIKFFSIQHQVLYVSAFNIFKDNILFGVGPKMFREICKKDKYYIVPQEDVSSSSCKTSPHNTYLQLLAETGLIGALPLIILFFLVSFVFLKKFIILYFFKNKKYLNDSIILMYITLYISLWPVIPSGNFFNNYMSAIYYLPIGFIFYLNNIAKKNKEVF